MKRLAVRGHVSGDKPPAPAVEPEPPKGKRPASRSAGGGAKQGFRLNARA